MPAEEVPTVIVRWQPSFASASQAMTALRSGEPPVVARVNEDAVCFDLRTVRGDDLELLCDAIIHAVTEQSDDDDENNHPCCDDHPLPVLCSKPQAPTRSPWTLPLFATIDATLSASPDPSLSLQFRIHRDAGSTRCSMPMLVLALMYFTFSLTASGEKLTTIHWSSTFSAGPSRPK